MACERISREYKYNAPAGLYYTATVISCNMNAES